MVDSNNEYLFEDDVSLMQTEIEISEDLKAEFKDDDSDLEEELQANLTISQKKEESNNESKNSKDNTTSNKPTPKLAAPSKKFSRVTGVPRIRSSSSITS